MFEGGRGGEGFQDPLKPFRPIGVPLTYTSPFSSFPPSPTSSLAPLPCYVSGCDCYWIFSSNGGGGSGGGGGGGGGGTYLFSPYSVFT